MSGAIDGRDRWFWRRRDHRGVGDWPADRLHSGRPVRPIDQAAADGAEALGELSRAVAAVARSLDGDRADLARRAVDVVIGVGRYLRADAAYREADTLEWRRVAARMLLEGVEIERSPTPASSAIPAASPIHGDAFSVELSVMRGQLDALDVAIASDDVGAARRAAGELRGALDRLEGLR